MGMNAYEIVTKARANNRFTSSDFIANIFTSFYEMHGDRRFADDKAIICGIAQLDDLPVTVIAIEKG